MSKCYLIDADGVILGRLASKAAQILRGKHKPDFTPHLDCGDFVVVINAEKVKVSGSKEKDKTYFRHSGYPGGDKYVSLETMRAMHPERIIEHAVEGMLPGNRLGAKIFKKLKVIKGADYKNKNAERIKI